MNRARDVQVGRRYYQQEMARREARRAAAALAEVATEVAAGRLNRRATPQQRAEAWHNRTYGLGTRAPASARLVPVARPPPFLGTRWGLVSWGMAVLVLFIFLAIVGNVVDHDDSASRLASGANVHHATATATATVTAAARATEQPVGVGLGAPQSQTVLNLPGPEDVSGGDGVATTLDLIAAGNNDGHGTNFPTDECHHHRNELFGSSGAGNVTTWLERKVYFVKKTLVAWSIDRTCTAAPWRSDLDETGTRLLFSAADVARDVLLEDDTLWTMIQNDPEYDQVFVWYQSAPDISEESKRLLLVGLHPSQPVEVPWPCQVHNSFQRFVIFPLCLIWNACLIAMFLPVVTIQKFPMVTAGALTVMGIVWYAAL
jgi:hypothetical protein